MFWKRNVVLAQEYLGFLLLNMFDLFLTGWIFKHSGEEANGLAEWVLQHFGRSGFAVYKFIMVVILIFICEVIAVYNVQRARMVILGGCALYLMVVIWECFLIFTYIDHPQPTPDGSQESSAKIMLRARPVLPDTHRFVAPV